MLYETEYRTDYPDGQERTFFVTADVEDGYGATLTEVRYHHPDARPVKPLDVFPKNVIPEIEREVYEEWAHLPPAIPCRCKGECRC